MMTTQQVKSKYGIPNELGEGYLVFINLPYPMRLAWDTTVSVTRMRCHERVADNFLRVFNELLDYYGYDEIRRLGIDLFGGCFFYRKQRTSSAWSKHSWGIAIDLDPSRNLLRETHRTARFARPEYKKMIEIFDRNGFLSLGVERDMDWMHFEIRE